MTDQPIHPTTHPEVNAVLQQFVEGASAILGDQLVGFYLFGSLVRGDFDEMSDIDAVVATEGEISKKSFTALSKMHADIIAVGTYWATNLEVSYIPKKALRRYDSDNATHPRLERGKDEKLYYMHHHNDWVIERYELLENGLALIGPPPETLIDPVSPDDLRRAMLGLIHSWIVTLPDNMPDSRGGQSYVVLTLCRLLYTLEQGGTASKPDAVAWALETLDASWHALINSAWEGRQHPGEEPLSEDMEQTIALINYTIEFSKQYETLPE